VAGQSRTADPTLARQENDNVVLRGSSGADESDLRARGRAAAAAVLGTQDFTLRVTVSGGVRRVEVVLSGPATPAVQSRLRAELTRVLELNAARGDSVTIYAP